MSFGNQVYTTNELAARTDMFTKLSASLVNLMETGIITEDMGTLCTDVIDTMQELLEDVRGGASLRTLEKPTPKRSTKK